MSFITPPSYPGFSTAAYLTAPNNVVNVAGIIAVGGTTNVDLSLVPKGTGAKLAAVPDNTATGGNKRGSYAVDWQTQRGLNTQVASAPLTTIGGGASNTASANSATVAGGQSNSATAQWCFVGGGSSNTASGADYASVVGGNGNTASGANSAVLGGNTNTASGVASSVLGGVAVTTRGRIANIAWGHGATAGRQQACKQTLRVQTADATPTVMTADGTASAPSTQTSIPINSVAAFRGLVTARNSTNTDAAAWEVSGALRSGGANWTLLAGATVTLLGATGGAAAWTVGVTAVNAAQSFVLTATGAAATTIDWVADMWQVENTA